MTAKSIYFDLIYRGIDPWKPFTQDTEKLGLRKRCCGQRDDFSIPKKIIETEDVKSEVNTSSFVYGEVKYLPFAKVLKTCRPKKADNFYDLGSGAGKGVFTAALSCNFKKVKGVEYLPSLTKLSNMVLKRYSKKIKPKLSLNKQKQKIEFVNSDILKFDCSDADMIYIASTTFNQPLMDDIAEHIKKVRPGAVLLTLTASLPQRIFRLSGKIKMATTWDSSTTVYIYKRRWKILSKEPKKKVIGEPKTFKKIFQYANENYKNGFYHQALKYYDKALRVKKNRLVYFNRALTHLCLNNSKKALNDVNYILKKPVWLRDKRFLSDALYLRALAYDKMGVNPQKTIETIDLSLSANPWNRRVKQFRKNFYKKLKD